MKCSLCHYVNPPEGPTHNARSCPLRQTQCRRSLPEGHPFKELGQCVSALCVHKEKCNTCGVTGHLYGTQALHPGRWKLNSKGRLVRKPNKQPLSKEDFVCTLMTDLSIQSMVDNSVSVSTTAAEDAHTRRVATSRLHANSNAERLDINETVRVMEGLGSKAALLQEENKASFQTLYSNVHLGAVAANRLAASAAESSLDETTPPSSDVEAHSTSEEEAAAAAAGARRGSGRGRKQGVGRGSGKGRRPGGGHGGGHGARDGFRSGKKALRGSARGKATKAEHAAKAERVHHAGRRSRTDRYAAAIAKSQRPSSGAAGSRQGTPSKEKARRGNNGATSAAPIDVDDLEDTSMPVGRDDGWPVATRARFECNLPVFVSPRFGGTPPVRIAHAAVVELYQCPIEDVDAEIAGVVVKGACDSQVRGFMLPSGTLSSAQVSEWLCSAMSPALRRATLPSMAYAVQRVVDTAAAAAAVEAVGVRVGAAASDSATTRGAAFPAPHGAAARASSACGGVPASAAPAPVATTTRASTVTAAFAAAPVATTPLASASTATAASVRTAAPAAAPAAAPTAAPVAVPRPRAAVASVGRAGIAVAPVYRAPVYRATFVPRIAVAVPERPASWAPRASVHPVASNDATSVAISPLASVVNVSGGSSPAVSASVADAAAAAAPLAAHDSAIDGRV